MKKIILLFGILSIFIPMSKINASTLSCSQVDGLSIFGYSYSEYKFIGAISNEYNSESIANEYGAGNEYSSDSIFNDYGNFGSEYSSYSAFNDYASKPPIIVDDNYKFVGYLTTSYKTPSINTYEAIACAKASYSSANSDMEDITFKNIPSSSNSYGYSASNPTSQPTSCPANASLTATGCSCNSGYITDPTKSYCILEPKQQPSCPINSSLGADNQCYCNTGFSNQNNSCAPVVVTEIKQETTIKKDTLPKAVSTPTVTKKTGKQDIAPKEVKKEVIVEKTEAPTQMQAPEKEVEKPSEPVKKTKWYQKIFNWFKKK